MLASLALIFLLGILLGGIFNKLKLPSLIGMILAGILIGPYALDLLDPSILEISGELRELALVIILTRAGLALNIQELKKVGRPAILMCFVPALLEIVGVVLIAIPLLGLSFVEAALLGTVIAAVSPAVIVPRMIKLMDEGYGKGKSIPQLIMAGASVDDIFVIILFTVFTGLASGGSFSGSTLIQIPVSILLGIGLGSVVGLMLTKTFKVISMRDSVKILLLLSLSFLMLTVEEVLEGTVALSGLLAIMSMSAMLLQTYEELAKRLAIKFSKIWVGAEILLFVLVGATVDIQYVASAGILAVIIVIIGLFFRISGVGMSLIGTTLTMRERAFCMIAYSPKATVQAAIGSIPLAMGLECGPIILTVAVVAIVVTAPIGAIGIDYSYKKYLSK